MNEEIKPGGLLESRFLMGGKLVVVEITDVLAGHVYAEEVNEDRREHIIFYDDLFIYYQPHAR